MPRDSIGKRLRSAHLTGPVAWWPVWPLRRQGRRGLWLALLLALLPLYASPSVAHAFTYTVCASGCDFSSVQAAINAAGTGDTIDIMAGTYPGQLVVPYSLTFVGAGAGSTLLDGGGNVTLKVALPTHTSVGSHPIGAQGTSSGAFAATSFNVA